MVMILPIIGVNMAIASIQNLKAHPYTFYQALDFVIVDVMVRVLPDANGLGNLSFLWLNRLCGDALMIDAQIRINNRYLVLAIKAIALGFEFQHFQKNLPVDGFLPHALFKLV